MSNNIVEMDEDARHFFIVQKIAHYLITGLPQRKEAQAFVL